VKQAKAACGLIKKFHGTLTSRWDDAGFFLLKTNVYDTYCAGMDHRISSARAEIMSLADSWDVVVAAEREFKGDAFRESMMPMPDDFVRSFDASYAFQGLPNVDGLELNSFTLSGLRKALDKRNEEALRETTNTLRAEMITFLSKITETLADPDKIFRDSLIGNIKELVEQRSARDMCDSPELRAQFDSVRDIVLRHTPDELRKNKALRSRAAREADELIASMTDQGKGRMVR